MPSGSVASGVRRNRKGEFLGTRTRALRSSRADNDNYISAAAFIINAAVAVW